MHPPEVDLPPSRSAIEIENTARDHPLYHNVSAGPDGLYHCPWEGQSSCKHKPEKLKCNYDKFVDSHLKPYRCQVLACENLHFSSTAVLLRHEREAHAMHGHSDKPFLCTYDGCERGIHGNGFPRHWNLRDHLKRVHSEQANVSRSRSVSPSVPPPPPSSKHSHYSEEPRALAAEATSTESYQPRRFDALVNKVSTQATTLSSLREAQDKLAAAFSDSQTRNDAFMKEQYSSVVELLNLKDNTLKFHQQVDKLKEDFEALAKTRADSRDPTASICHETSEDRQVLAKIVVSCLKSSVIDRLVQGIQLAPDQASSGTSDAASDQTSRSSSSNGQSERPSTQNSTTCITPVSIGVKRAITGEGCSPGDDHNDGDRENKRYKSGHAKKLQNNRPFACPFRKNDPTKFSYHNLRYKTCVTTSWRDISHLKEHISRVHKARCTGCNMFLKSGEELQSHERCSNSLDTQCTAVEGLGEETIERLKPLRTSSHGRQTSWEILYINMFPVTWPIPEPWFENEIICDSEEDLRKKVEKALLSRVI